jgi:K+-transporting ATPase ATPase C chain
VNYNSAGSGGSNKRPSNPDYLQVVKDRIDTFLAHNPGITRNQVPAEMVTASGSGLDPHISPAAAMIQVKRVARARGLDEPVVRKLVEEHTEVNPVGPDVINVLRLNISLDKLK